jgi:hypothetical protein
MTSQQTETGRTTRRTGGRMAVHGGDELEELVMTWRNQTPSEQTPPSTEPGGGSAQTSSAQ